MDIVYHNTNTGTSEEIVDIKKISLERIHQVMKQFAEGSSSLEKCLLAIYNSKIITKACCKGNHIEVNEDIYGDKANINSEAYIVFEKDSDWQTYLSPQLIQDKFVIIGDNYIRHYGEDHDVFFEMLSNDFSTGKKDNQTFLNDKKKSYSSEQEDELKLQSYEFSLVKNGFSDEQISVLLSLIIKIKKISQDHTIDDSEAIRMSNELISKYNKTFQHYFNEKLQCLGENKNNFYI